MRDAARAPPPLPQVVAKLGALGCEAQFVHAEMGSVDDVTAIVPAHVKAFGSLDGLANCAGDTSRGSIQSQTAESWDQLMAVNARAPFLLVQAASNTMRELGTAGGSIVNIITITSHGGQPYLCGYAASKGACATLTRNAAHALRHDRIRVNGINIGWTNSAAEHLTQVASGAGEDWLAKAVEKVPFGRLVEPADVAALTAFLLSAESGVMTGSVRAPRTARPIPLRGALTGAPDRLRACAPVASAGDRHGPDCHRCVRLSL